MKQESMIAFYSIKPIYSEKIFSGEKTYELRRHLPNNKIQYVIFYSTMPVGKVIGYAQVKELHKNTVSKIWNMVSESSGISKNDYKKYFYGSDYACAIELTGVKKFVKPFPVDKITKSFTAPQSFCYLDEDSFRKIKRRKAIPI